MWTEPTINFVNHSKEFIQDRFAIEKILLKLNLFSFLSSGLHFTYLCVYIDMHHLLEIH